ncbi:ATP-binding cassette domain-containing protein [Bradyrhizobium sp. 190]|uniref:ABC transporter permease subunit n=1 Tax=Bradyrhizobium sp. 190 TaxID=2782658 RepID=UPI001FF9358F|nr:ATP-binding cassette domain-containing protein [Bradyrhizobium sp. 190]MCK1513193.1 ATP-binding cassette domain-containing protein [Bradyrhizobium sp. 190]
MNLQSQEASSALDFDVPLSSASGRLAGLRMSVANSRRLGTILAVCLLCALATAPLLTSSSFGLARFVVVVAYLLAAIALNLVMGYAGEFVLAHPVIMGVAAYAAGILDTVFGWPAAFALPSAVLVGTAAGLLVMLPGLRVRGWYYALITMFAVLVLPPIVVIGAAWTGGEDGLSGIRPLTLFGTALPDWALFEMALGMLALVWWSLDNFTRSGWGYRLRALRDARQAAEATGINLTETRLVVYVLTAIPAAMAGVILTYSSRFVGIDAFGINLMLMLLTGVVLGGPGTRWGPVVGMAPLLALSFWVGPFSPYNAVGLGVGLLVGAIVFPDGIMAALQRRLLRPNVAPIESRPDLLELSEVADGLRAASDSATSPHILRVSGVSKQFGGHHVLKGVEFEMRRGAVVGLVGPNGSGKSTLLNVLSSFLRPDAGFVEINGADTRGLPVFKLARTGVGRTFQVPQLVEEFSTIENIELGLVAAEPRAILSALASGKGERRRARRRHKQALSTFRLIGLPESVRNLPVETLSLGLKRVVEVGRAIVGNPHLILLDEPCAGLNDEERHRLGKLLKTLQGMGISVLVVEHNMSFLLSICEELVLLESGKVTCTARVDEPMPEPLVAYLNLRAPNEEARP